MRNFYTLIYSLNNVEKNENYLLELSEIEQKEQTIEKFFGNLNFSPRKEVLENILNYARQA